LRLDLGMGSHFEVLASPIAAMAAEEAARAGLPFSAGGVTYPGDLGLPVDPDLVLAQYPRLEATGAWLFRSFLAKATDGDAMARGVGAIRDRLDHWGAASHQELAAARVELEAVARRV